MVTWEERVWGSLLGGAVGDALGEPVEFQGRAWFTKNGPVTDYASGAGHITDNTQMVLSTTEAILRGGDLKKELAAAYYRWSLTQDGRMPQDATGLAAEEWLYRMMATSTTCMDALGTMSSPTEIPRPVTGSTDSCAVSRAAPFGWCEGGNPETAWANARRDAMLTHWSETAGDSAGALAYIIQRLINGENLQDAAHGAAQFTTTASVSGALQRAWRRPGRVTQRTLEADYPGGGRQADGALSASLWPAPSATPATSCKQ